MLKVAGLVFLLGVGAVYLLDYLGGDSDVKVPQLPDTDWGPLRASKKDDTSIRPFTINVPAKVIDELKVHLARERKFVPPLEKSAWNYGMPGKSMENVVDYWKTKYNWSERQALLNKYPQYVTNIQGLDIHFYRVKPNVDKARNVKVIPLLLVHGWPGSIVEFQKIIPMLTTPRADRGYVFEVIAPSLPGYGFSEAAVRPGLGPAQIGVILKNLMTRLGFEKFYTQGGDWGSIIVANMASMFPERVSGVHSNMCVDNSAKSLIYRLLAAYWPSLIVSAEHESKVYPLKKHFAHILRESGYFHLQASKPDTIGNALSESPVSLAIYILEKFSTWTNKEFMQRDDGGLLEKFTMDELLDNVMVYWVSNSITTSVRLYSETFNSEYMAQRWDSMPVKVPSACAAFPHELAYTPEKLLKFRYKNLTQYTHFPRGGHFAAFEEPKLLADDVWTFVGSLEKGAK